MKHFVFEGRLTIMLRSESVVDALTWLLDTLTSLSSAKLESISVREVTPDDASRIGEELDAGHGVVASPGHHYRCVVCGLTSNVTDTFASECMGGGREHVAVEEKVP